MKRKEPESNGQLNQLLIGLFFFCLQQAVASHSVSKTEHSGPQPVYVVEAPHENQIAEINVSTAVNPVPTEWNVVDLGDLREAEGDERFVPAFGNHPARIERADGNSKPLSPVVGSSYDESFGGSI